MEEEIRKIQVLYNTEINRLISIKIRYYNIIAKWRINLRTKQYYINRVVLWFKHNTYLIHTQRDYKIKEIKKRYSNASKKALLVGINYVNTSAELRGCVNDVNDLKQMLSTKYNYVSSNIVTLMESQATKQNILTQLTKLLQSSKSGDTLFFSFSGHGYHREDLTGEELDGRDELLISVDKFAISDDELKHIIDTYHKHNVTLIALVDTCHSGTILDLPYQYLKGDRDMIHHELCTETHGPVICVSGCRDDQVSMDAYLQGDFNGAMTFHFIQVINENDSITWKACIKQLREKLKVLHFRQIPQLTSGKHIDVDNLYINL